MSANGRLADIFTRHQLFLQRYAGGQYKRIKPLLKTMARDIQKALRGHDLTSYQVARYNVLLAEIGQITSSTAGQLEAELMPNLAEFAAYEAQFTQRAVQGAVSVALVGLAPEFVSQAVLSTPLTLVSGQTVQQISYTQLFDTFAAGVSREVMTAVDAGMIAGETSQNIVRQIMGFVQTRSFQQAEAVVRTATNHAGAVAREQFYDANADIIAMEEWVSTLDMRTSAVCRARDGQRYPRKLGPRPPAHYNCRSIRIPIVADEFAILRKGSTRASMDGPVSSQATYQSWLRNQPKAVQDEVLGIERAKLFRSGQIDLQGFVDDAGREYTLDELKAREGLTLQ